ncbi:MAG TPA: hypothetical protein P5120_19585 [Spirochaetota bacterium]|nr:hypothetical protein [Spirochaetota bacterium]
MKTKITAIEDEKKVTARFLVLCGSWEDKKTAEEQINEIYKSRRSRRDKKASGYI